MSVSVSKFAERAEILSAMAEELCCRMYRQKTILRNPATCYTWLINPGSQKIKHKLEKHFPEIPDLSKIVGFEAISQQHTAQSVVQELSPFMDILLDVIDFAASIKAALAVEFIEFRLSFNRTLCLLYLGLIRSYCRVFMLLASISERRAIAALINGCNKWSVGAPMPSLTEVNHLLLHCDSIYGHFSEQFAPFGGAIGNSLTQLQESMSLYFNSDHLRNKHILNPANDTAVAVSGFPSYHKLSGAVSIGTVGAGSAQSDLSAESSNSCVQVYPELQSGDIYSEYVIYSCIACPSVMYLADSVAVQEVLKLCSGQCFFIRIYRDVLLNVHDELDQSFSLYAELPKERQQRDGVVLLSKQQQQQQLPKATKGSLKDQFKWDKFLKECYTQSMSCGQRHKEKRALLTAEMASLIGIIACNPGLIAPKMPILVALGSMARAELLFYYSHLHAQDSLRKDMRKHLQVSDFEPLHHDVTKLLHQLMELIALIHKYYAIIQCYYSSFLGSTDLRVITQLVEEVGGLVSPLGELHESLVSSFTIDLTNISSIPDPDSSTTVPSMDRYVTMDLIVSPFYQKLRALRLNWNRLVAVLSTDMVPVHVLGHGRRQNFSSMNHLSAVSTNSAAAAATASASSNLLALVHRMNDVVIRSRYLDDLDGLIQEFFSPHELWWFSARIQDEYTNSLQCQQSEAFRLVANSSTAYVGGYFAFANFVRRNVHPSVPEEADMLSPLVLEYYNILLKGLRETFLGSLTQLEKYQYHFESGTHPLEASVRLRKVIESKQGLSLLGHGFGHGVVVDALPGIESEYHDIVASGSEISQLALHSEHISHLLAAASCPFVCYASIFGYKFDLIQHLKQQLNEHLTAQFKDIFFPNNRAGGGSGGVDEGGLGGGETGRDSLIGANIGIGAVISALTGTTHANMVMTRPFIAIQRLINCCHAAHAVLSSIDHYTLYENHKSDNSLPDSIHELLRAQLYKMSFDVTVSPPGTSLVAVNPASAPCEFVQHTIGWFKSLIGSLCGDVTSKTWTGTVKHAPAVWVRSQNIFMSPSSSTSRGTANSSDKDIGSFLNLQDMECLCSVLGIQGVRALDLMFFGLISDKLLTMIPFLQENEMHWRTLARGSHTPAVMSTCSKIQGLEAFQQTMISIGVILAVRKCVHGGLSVTQQKFAPHVHGLSLAVCQSIDNSSAIAHDLLLSCGILASDCGTVGSGSIDFALLESLTGSGSSGGGMMISVAHLELLWRVLPIATALTFTTPQRWHGVHFNHGSESFTNNEHCIALALAELLRVLAYKRCLLHNVAGIDALSGGFAAGSTNQTNQPDAVSMGVVGDEATDAGGNATTGVSVNGADAEDDGKSSSVGIATLKSVGNKNNNNTSSSVIARSPLLYADEFRRASREFIRLSCNIQLDMRYSLLQKEKTYAGFPVNAMIFVLELYVKCAAPVVTRDVLEEYCPYTILHGSYVDMAMGRKKGEEFGSGGDGGASVGHGAHHAMGGGQNSGDDIGNRDIMSREDAMAVL